MPLGIAGALVVIYALIADVHSNIEALEAVLADARELGAERFVFLGDMVGYGADPVAVVERIAALCEIGHWAILGNHDAAVARLGAVKMHDEALAAMRWTRRQLALWHVQFLAQRPVILCEGNMCFVHASAHAPTEWTYIEGVADAQRSLDAAMRPFVFCGHVHNPVVYYLGHEAKLDLSMPEPGELVPISARRMSLAIVGSAGQPRDGSCLARYALFNSELEQLVFRSLDYDYVSAAAKIRAAGLPDRFARWLEGRS